MVNNRVTVPHEEPSEYHRRYKRPFILQMFVICSLGRGVSVSTVRPAASLSPLQLKQNVHHLLMGKCQYKTFENVLIILV